MTPLNATLPELSHRAFDEGRRLVAPLVGFPGLQLTGCTIKLAQQNYGEHYKVLRALAERYQPDLLFPLMDLAVEVNALGRYTVFPTDDAATVPRDRFDMDQLEDWRDINISFDTRLQGYVETVKLMSLGLRPQILRGAYVTGPYSLAALIMGAEDTAVATLSQPAQLTRLLEFVTERIQEYVRQLVAAGAQVICILEPSAVMLGPEQFRQFSARYIAHINQSCRYAGLATVYHTCGNTMHLIEAMAESGVQAVSLDAPDAGVDLPEAASRVSEETVIIGNISPTGTLLRGTPDEVRLEVEALLAAMERFPNFILSTGCDLPQETPEANIRAFMEAGRAYRLTG